MRALRNIVTLVVLSIVTLCTAMAAQRDAVHMRHRATDTLAIGYRHIDAVQRMAIHRDTAGARAIWLDILRQDSTYAPALYYMSQIEADPDMMTRYAYRAFLGDTTNKWYTENYATALVSTKQYTRSIPIYRRLMRLDAKNLQAYHALAIIYATSGMPYSAIAILDSAELRVGYNHYFAQMRQRLLLDTRQYDRAIETGIRRTMEHPYDVEARTTLARAYDAAGNDSLAVATYEAAFRLDSTDIATISAIVDYYYRKHDIRRMLDYDAHLFRSKELSIEDKLERIELYTSDRAIYGNNYLRIGGIIQGLAIDYPNNPDVIQIYATHMIAGGDYDYALAYLRRHLEDEGTTDANYMDVLQLEYYMEHTEVLTSDLQRALELFPNSLAILSFAAYIDSSRGEYDSAIAHYRHGLDIATTDEDRSTMLGSIGDVYHEMGDDARAFRYYRKALKYNPDNALVLNNYAYFLSLKDKSLDKALEMAVMAVSLEPNNESYVDTYAWVLHRLGRNEDAKRIMRQALSLSGQRDASLLAHYGDILWALGESFMADTYWQKAVDMGYDSDAMRQHIEEIKGAK